MVEGTEDETGGVGRPDGVEVEVGRIPEYVSGLSSSFMPVYSSSGGMSDRWCGVAGEGGARVVGAASRVISWGSRVSSSSGVGARRVMFPLCRIFTRRG